MPIDRTRHVVGVFGRNAAEEDELRAAELLAIAIDRAGAVLLSGAAPPEGGFLRRPPNVKDVAVYALGPPSDDSPATWVGVDNQRDAAAPQRRGGRALLLTPGWRHRRNFVEAVICDAAFVIGGTSAGTASEAVFSAYLARRVVVMPAADDPPPTPQVLKTRIGDRVTPSSAGLAVDRGIEQALDWAERDAGVLTTRPLPTNDVEAAEAVESILDQCPLGRPRPEFDTLVDEKSWDDYVNAALAATTR